jgi:hypothetical protein
MRAWRDFDYADRQLRSGDRGGRTYVLFYDFLHGTAERPVVRHAPRALAARYDEPVIDRVRPSGDQLLAKLRDDQRARLRIYIGAAPGVGKTYSMLEDAHAFRREGIDVAIGFVETYGRAETEAQISDLELIPRRTIEYRGVVLEEMDVDGILRRRPQLCVVDELAHTNVPAADTRSAIRTSSSSSTPASASSPRSTSNTSRR